MIMDAAETAVSKWMNYELRTRNFELYFIFISVSSACTVKYRGLFSRVSL